MTGTVQQSVLVIFEPPCIFLLQCLPSDVFTIVDDIPLLLQRRLCRHFIETEIPLLSAYLFPQQYVPLPSSRNTCYIAP
jgi:phage terminase Nu1 subunit (DNA packaging protein)